MKRLFVFLHGFLGQPGDWQETLSALELTSEDEVWCPNFFQRDLLAKIKPQESLAHWAVAFNETVAEKRADKNVLVGYSMGGRLALHAITSGPRLWDCGVIVSAHPGLLSDEEAEARLQADKIWAQKFRCEDWLPLMHQWFSQRVFDGTSEVDRNESDFDREFLALALENWSVARHNIHIFDLMRLGAPMLWLTGETDKKYGDLYRQLASQAVPGDYQVIPGAGHRIWADRPQQLAAAICENLDFVI